MTEPTNIDEILNRQRLASAISALADPSRGTTDQALHLDEHERATIQKAIEESPHPLAGFAQQLIDQWDHAAADDRVAGLLLFTEITTANTHQREHMSAARSHPSR